MLLNEKGEWEYRIWTPMTNTEETENPPTLSVVTFKGTREEFLVDLKFKIFDHAERKEIGPLMSIAAMLLQEVVRHDT